MTASGNSGLNLSGFFTPAYNKQFTTTFGTLTFNNSNGQTHTGNCGNGYGSLTITRSYWRETPRQETEVHGIFSNQEGNQGGFTLNFESECVFSGEYWYNEQTNQISMARHLQQRQTSSRWQLGLQSSDSELTCTIKRPAGRRILRKNTQIRLAVHSKLKIVANRTKENKLKLFQLTILID